MKMKSSFLNIVINYDSQWNKNIEQNYISYRPTNLSNGRFAHLSRWLHFSSFPQVQFFSFLIELENLPIEVFYFFYDDLRISCVKFSQLHWTLILNKDMEILKPFLIAGILRIKRVFSRSAACWRYSNLWFWCCSNWQSRQVKTPHVLTFSENCTRTILGTTGIRYWRQFCRRSPLMSPIFT